LSGSGISRIEIAIKRIWDNNYWFESSWNSEKKWIVASGNNYWSVNTENVIWTSDKQYEITSRAIDNATNIEIPSCSLTINFDLFNPTINVIYPMNNAWLNELFNIYGTSSDTGGSGLNKVEILLKQHSNDNYWSGSSWSTEEQWLTPSGIENWYYDTSLITWTQNTHYRIYSRVTDFASNVGIPTNVTIFQFDFEEPISMIDNPGNNLFLNKLNTVTGTAQDTGGSGLESVMVGIERLSDKKWWNAFSNNWVDDFVPITSNGLNQWTFDSSNVTWTTDSEYNIYSIASDYANNIESNHKSIKFMFDDKQPTISIKINNDEVFTNSKLVTLNLSAIDTGSGVSQIAFSNDNSEWTSWEPFLEIKTFEVPDIDGNKTIYYKVKDRAGNIAKESDFIILDTTPPHSLMITVNNGSKKTNSPNVTLDLSAIDDLSGLDEFLISLNRVNWIGFEPHSKVTRFYLPDGDGEYYIYFQASDRARNRAEPIYCRIELNTTTKIIDTDGDKYPDIIDAFPDDSTQWSDSDEDTYGDNPDGTNPDAFPNDSTQWEDRDGDNYGDNPNGLNPDYYPNDASRWKKEDGKPPDKKEPSNKDDSIWIMVSAAVIIIIFVVILLIFLLIKRKKKGEVEQDLLPASETEKEIQQQLTQQPPQPDQKSCTTCGSSLKYYSQNDKYYCHQCKKYD
jgi:hypothetical protein